MTAPGRPGRLRIDTDHVVPRIDQRGERRDRKIGRAHKDKAHWGSPQAPALTSCFLSLVSLRMIIPRLRPDI